MRSRYDSSLTDEQWALIEPKLPKPKPGGRPRSLDMRQVIDGILYVLHTGCQWRMLPREFGNHNTVYWYFRDWRLKSVWALIHDAIRDEYRSSQGRDPEPSALIIDSQTTKTTEKGGRAATTPGRR
jgi:putative transposase